MSASSQLRFTKVSSQPLCSYSRHTGAASPPHFDDGSPHCETTIRAVCSHRRLCGRGPSNRLKPLTPSLPCVSPACTHIHTHMCHTSYIHLIIALEKQDEGGWHCRLLASSTHATSHSLVQIHLRHTPLFFPSYLSIVSLGWQSLRWF